ncbi:MAG: hypothetical protein F4X54_01110 [Chloroflexi bacterium]|nr:hypothetical protein [Chloroflexota bacterium]
MNSTADPFKDLGQVVEDIPVRISYEIIHLFSEGLYKSPHKAIEELVTNGYDANAQRVHVLLPEAGGDRADADPLWVIDDGDGMDEEGFRQLWLVAESHKADDQQLANGRSAIGQFGIGKLASYVLAWNLTHVSRVDDRFLLTSMDFHRAKGLSDAQPVLVSLREVSEDAAKERLAAIEDRDPAAWAFMFGGNGTSASWTAAALTDFKDLYHHLQTGTLKWVLSTSLPLHSDFQIWLNGEQLASSKENMRPLRTVVIDKTLPGIGPVKGTAAIYDRILSGKSDQIGRSHGFFVRVRKRVINLEDELFGLEAQNHAAWSRFALEVDADGLREHLLSSREGVRDSDAVRAFRQELKDAFNVCRAAYEEKNRQKDLDLVQLLKDGPSSWVYDPLLLSVWRTAQSGLDSFYFRSPRIEPGTEPSQWMSDFEDRIKKNPFDRMTFENVGPNAPVLRYEPDDRNLVVNNDHPFIGKLGDVSKSQRLKLFATSESLLEGHLYDHGVDRTVIASLLDDRDRALRLLAGDAAPTVQEVVRRLQSAAYDSTALERATGAVFELLGLKYERKGGNAPGPDGVLSARLGRQGDSLADYKLVYDAKRTNEPAVPADKVVMSSLEEFRRDWNADFGFFIAEQYQGEAEPGSKLNKQFATLEDGGRHLTLLKVRHLEHLARLHYRHGVTLAELRSLFERARTVADVDEWLSALEERLIGEGEVPLETLLLSLDAQKGDPHAIPSISVGRSQAGGQMLNYSPERLRARLKAVQSIIGTRWIEVDDDSYEVIMQHNAHEVLAELERNTIDLHGRFPHFPIRTEE